MMKEMRGNIICSIYEIDPPLMFSRTVESLNCSSEALEVNALSGSDDSDKDDASRIPHDSDKLGNNKCTTDKKKRKCKRR